MSENNITAPPSAAPGLQPKPWIAAIAPYVPGKAKGAQGAPLIKLSANENPLGTSPKALAAASTAAPPSLYPDPDSTLLRERLGALHGLDPARIICGTGSDELLNLAAEGYAGPGDEVVFSRYSFPVYEIAARRCGAEPVIAPDTDFAADVAALLGCLTERTKVLFLANPNNPTGSYMEASDLARLHRALPAHMLLVVDQAYGEYLPPERDDGALALAKTHDNVLVTRTFSKIYGLAGARIGWATGAPAIISTLGRIRGPFNLTSAGQAMALAALDDPAFIDASRAHNAKERERFIAAMARLGNLGVRALPSEGNFVLVLFDGALKAKAVNAALLEAGYAVRSYPPSAERLADALRITMGTAAQMAEISAIIAQMAEAAQ